MENRRIRSRGIEVNTMAILDASGFVKATQDLSDDRITFLEAVRSASLVPDNGIAPTYKMFEAIFQILKEENSLELIMSSYQLLNELDKRYPRVYISKVELSKLPSPSNAPELVVVEEAWSPFTFGSDSERDGANKNSGESFDSTSFHLLIQDLVKVVIETKSEELETKSLRNMVLLQYLTSVLEGDFVPRYSICKDIMNWNLLRESLLNMLLGSRRISYKGLIKDCVSIMCEMSHVHTEISHDIRLPENSAAEQLKDCDAAVAISFPEVKKCTCIALQKLLLMVFNEPKWKLELIVQYFQKYIAKPSIRTRQSSDPIDDATYDGILKSFSNSNCAKNIIKKISAEVAQLLLAHAFQAYLSLSTQHSAEGICQSKEDVRDSSLVEICKNMISTFTNLRTIDEDMEILPFGKEALFTAATILSTKS
ncbi:Negative regulator of systemic acquired resistance SNI1 [Camellia lanceoleosa]|uniref:Negative regulator of systemic acquired resistance SNI1 n=1 Tax=Camellia lanceoleosa TaxID=1840588 RepID=A0ACC0GHF4_9ERIC|nr:Negative regulator of systemic acquired resistance SNI1 [Camellia lanceoleosa]